MRGAVTTAFLDRDGTINRKAPEGDYVKSPGEFEFLPGAIAGIRNLSRAGLRVIVVTNQRGISLGRMTERDLERIHKAMLAELTAAGARLDRIYHCPHQVQECACRKPAIGMFLDARRDFPEIDFGHSVVIGDSVEDMEAGQRLGCLRVLISHTPRESVDHTAPTLSSVARWLSGNYHLGAPRLQR